MGRMCFFNRMRRYNIKKDPFDEYIKNLPPTRKELGQAWRTAIGLQDVDGLKPSAYLYETAKKSIDGEISGDEAGLLIDSYYESKDGRFMFLGKEIQEPPQCFLFSI